MRRFTRQTTGRIEILIILGLFLYAGGACTRVPPASSGDPPSDQSPEDSMPDEFTCENVDLSGYWRFNGHGSDVAITQQGCSVMAVFLEDAVCEHLDEQGTTSTTRDDFQGMIIIENNPFAESAEVRMEGMVLSICSAGCTVDDAAEGDCSLSSNGIKRGTFTAEVSPDLDEFTLSWETDRFSGSDVYRRLDCRPKSPADWGLPTNREWNRTGDAFYDTNESCDEPAGFNAGVFGTVTQVDDSFGGPGRFLVEIMTDNGGTLRFESYSPPATLAVNEGDRVSPSTLVGSMSDPCQGLSITGQDSDGPVNPDCLQ